MTKLTNKKYKVPTEEEFYKKISEDFLVDKKKSKPKNTKKIPYKGMDTGRGHITLEETPKKKWVIKDKVLTKVKRYFDDIRYNR